MCVAYKYIIGNLPWMEFMQKFKEQSGFSFKSDMKEKEFYLNLRQKQAKNFDEQLIAHGGCLAPLFKLIKE